MHMPVGWFFSTAGQYLAYSEASGRLVVLPEPSAFALVALGIGIAGRHVIRARRRRQR